MTRLSPVVVLARDFDPTADVVMHALAALSAPVLRTDLSAFPTRLRIDAQLRDGRWCGRLFNDHHTVDLDRVGAIWYRNPSTYAFPSSMPSEQRDFAYREAKLGLGGVLGSLDVLWCNHPNRCADAIWKPYQWVVAAECGLDVADTMITNDPAAALQYVASRGAGEVITKALGPAGATVDGQFRVAYTRRLCAKDLEALDSVRLTVTTLQTFVPKAFEVRLTIIGDAWFPIGIEGSSERARTDWRSDPIALSYRYVPIPENVVEGVGRYLKRMNLAYAGLDFVVTPEDRWVFLEANTCPQFGFLEAATGAPMAAAMAHLLSQGGHT
jgi:ATP-grasp ribosomal peptide maturase